RYPPIILNVVAVPPRAAGLHTLADHARRGERNPQQEVRKRLSGEVAAEVESAAPESRHRTRGILLIPREGAATLDGVVAVYPAQVPGIVELVRDVALIIEVVIPEGGQRDVGKRDRRSPFELCSGQRMIDPELRVRADLVAIRAALHVLRSR